MLCLDGFNHAGLRCGYHAIAVNVADGVRGTFEGCAAEGGAPAGQQHHTPPRQLDGAAVDAAADGGCPPHEENPRWLTAVLATQGVCCGGEVELVDARRGDGRDEPLDVDDVASALQLRSPGRDLRGDTYRRPVATRVCFQLRIRLRSEPAIHSITSASQQGRTARSL